MSQFAFGTNQNLKFIIKNITNTFPKPRDIKVFELKIRPGQSVNLLNVPGVTEDSINASLFKGELKSKIQAGHITVTESNMELLQYDAAQKTFLQNAGVSVGLEPGTGALPLSGTNLSAVSASDGSNGWVVRQLTMDDIAPAYSASLAIVSTSTLETGASSVTPQFNATYISGPATSATLGDNDGNPSQNVLSTPNPIGSANTYVKTANNASVIFTLTTSKATVNSNPTATMVWQPRLYWGVGVAGGNNEAFIEALASNALASSRARSFTLNPVAQKIYYAVPSAYGACTFTVNGFSGGFNAPTVISVTNANGVTQNYDLYESINLLTGSVPVVVT